MTNRSWTRDEEIIVFNLYCKIPFQSSSKNNPEVIKIANLIGRTPSAVNMKIGNFGSFDENLASKNIVGLTHSSRLDKEIWEEFNNNWDELAFESERLIAEFKGEDVVQMAGNEISLPVGITKEVTVKQRVNQTFFRNAVLSSYNSACCITGLSNRQILIASHIKPWKDSDEREKTNPSNGLCLNALHDKAFDKGFITIDKNKKLHISNDISDVFDGASVDKFFKEYEGQQIRLPDKFLPDENFLEYHNDMIFENWK